MKVRARAHRFRSSTCSEFSGNALSSSPNAFSSIPGFDIDFASEVLATASVIISGACENTTQRGENWREAKTHATYRIACAKVQLVRAFLRPAARLRFERRCLCVGELMLPRCHHRCRQRGCTGWQWSDCSGRACARLCIFDVDPDYCDIIGAFLSVGGAPAQILFCDDECRRATTNLAQNPSGVRARYHIAKALDECVHRGDVPHVVVNDVHNVLRERANFSCACTREKES